MSSKPWFRRLCGIAAAALALQACSEVSRHPVPAGIVYASFSVFATIDPDTPIPEARVYLIFQDRGPRLLGLTDRQGEIQISVAEISNASAFALLACPQAPVLNCGALLTKKLEGLKGGNFILMVPPEAVY